MKNNISYYRHETGSHNHWKFKVLRKKYGWGGEGKFWALNNMIADAEGCTLELGDEGKLAAIAVDLDFEPTGLKDFIQYLLQSCKLIMEQNGGITTTIVQETFDDVMSRRQTDRKRKISAGIHVASDRKVDNSTRKTDVSTVEKQQSKVKEIKEEETKGKEEKEDIAAPPSVAPVHTPDQLKSFKVFSDWIAKEAPRVGKMKEPFTVEQYLKISKKYNNDGEKIRTLLLSMHNWEPLLKKNRSAYLTLDNWKRREELK